MNCDPDPKEAQIHFVPQAGGGTIFQAAADFDPGTTHANAAQKHHEATAFPRKPALTDGELSELIEIVLNLRNLPAV